MIQLTKLNGEAILINNVQIQFIEEIPESKITMMNGKYHIVKESLQEILDKEIEFKQKVAAKVVK